jgi:nicotinamide mononucleotide transporter
VGVPLLLKAGYYPSAVLYLVYGAFCAWGFWTWVRVRRALDTDDTDALEEVAA